MTAQLLTLSVNQQASGTKKFCFKMQHTCNILPLTRHLERDRYTLHGQV